MDQFNKDFDQHFSEMQKRVQKAQKLAIRFAIVVWVLTLGILGALGFVAYHFLSKVW
jgi:hypothetical protein